MARMAATPLPRRRWFQYSLRTLMLFVLLWSLACSWVAVRMQRARRQHAAVEAIRLAGGWAHYDYDNEEEQNPFAIPSELPEPPGPRWVRKWLGDDVFTKVVSAKLMGDVSLDLVQDLPGLQELQNLPQKN